ncbi:MAG: TlyA family RNA methyltransferase [Hyphomicrobium sp.]
MRLDERLVSLGLATTRSRARDLIARGFVRVDGAICDKPGRKCPDAAKIELDPNAPQFVSRGSEKLIAALKHFDLAVAGRIALDVGASTGGFTDALLKHGALKVYAVDVGRGQLDASLKLDGRVISLESQDARALTRAHIPDPIDAVVADVSFISLTKALGASLQLTAPGAWLAALIKPQFEAGRAAVSGGGIVRDEAARTAAVECVRAWISTQNGWRVMGVVPSPILGGSGNVEFLIGAVRDA